MNNSVALLYNFNEEKLKMIKMVCMMMQVRFKAVSYTHLRAHET